MIRRAAFGLPSVVLLASAATGCVTLAPRSRPVSPEARVVPGVPVLTFGFERCGAGSLAGALAGLGDPVDVRELDATLPKADNGGVLSVDLLAAARRRGHDAELAAGSPETVRAEIEAGRAAILMLRVLDAPGAAGDYYHYVLADGWDPARGLVRTQFGDGRARWTTFEHLERSWRPAGHATILVRPGPPRSSPADNAIRYAAALEAAGRPAEAVPLYRRLLADEPGSALLWTDLGNALAAAGEPAAAEEAYRRALALDPGRADAANNLAWLLYEAGERLDEAEQLAREAVALGGPDPHLALDTLGRVLHARGGCGEAADAFGRARDGAPAGAAPAIDLALGRALADCGRADEARAALERAAAGAEDPETRRGAEAALAALEAIGAAS